MARGGRLAARLSLLQPLGAKVCAGGGHGSRLLDQHHAGCPRVPLRDPGRVCPRVQPLPFIQTGAGLAGLCGPSPPARSHEQFCGSSATRFSPALPARLPDLDSPHQLCAWDAQKPRELAGPRTAWGDPSSGLGGLLPSQALSTRSSTLSTGLSQDPCPAPLPVLLLWMPFRQTTAAPVLTGLYAGLLPAVCF